jgi:hypothetical protein
MVIDELLVLLSLSARLLRMDFVLHLVIGEVLMASNYIIVTHHDYHDRLQ